MCSINHDLKAIFVHTPKTGGLYVEHILNKYYGFETYYLTRKDHKNFVDNEDGDYSKLNSGFLNIKKQGFYRYYQTSDEYNEKMNMDDDKWKSYYKFTFIRDPYERLVSSYNYLFNAEFAPFQKVILNRDKHSPFVFAHVSISQYDHLIDKEEKLEYNYIGNHNKLNEDLVNILFELGVTKIKHGYFIKNNIIINKSSGISKPYYELINNEEILKEVNKIVETDCTKFNFKKYESVEELLKESKLKTKVDNLELYNKLLIDDKIEKDIKIKLNDDTVLEVEEEFKFDNNSKLDINNVHYRELSSENHMTFGKLNDYLEQIKEQHISIGPMKAPKKVIDKLFTSLVRDRDPDLTRVYSKEEVERMMNANKNPDARQVVINYKKTDFRKKENESNNKFTCDESKCNAGDDCCVKDKKV